MRHLFIAILTGTLLALSGCGSMQSMNASAFAMAASVASSRTVDERASLV